MMYTLDCETGVLVQSPVGSENGSLEYACPHRIRKHEKKAERERENLAERDSVGAEGVFELVRVTGARS
jgi:hypothetical protein